MRIILVLLLLASCGKDVKVEIPAPDPTPSPPLKILPIKLSWNDNSDNEDGFIVYRQSSDGQWPELARTGENESAYTDESVFAGVKYCYRVSAYNAAGESGPTNVACKIAEFDTSGF